MKRVAVCLSGCLRSWRQVYDMNGEFWEAFQRRVLKEKMELYYFLSFWEFNTPCGYLLDAYHDRLISDGGWTEDDFRDDNKNAKKFEFLDKDTLESVGWTIEPTIEANLHTWEEYREQVSLSRNRTRKREDELWWESPAFLMRDSVRLKRKWEVFNGKDFDIVFWTRFDSKLILEDKFRVDFDKVNILNRFTADCGNHYTGLSDTLLFGKSRLIDFATELYPVGNLPFNYPDSRSEKNSYTVVEQVFRDALDYDYIPYSLSVGLWEDLRREYDEDYCRSFLSKQLV